MKSIVVMLALTSTAAASENNYAVAGLGTSIANNTPGWMLRVEQRVDARESAEDGKVLGGRLGLDLWRSGTVTGFNLPLGYYVGGQSGAFRATLGGGVGLWAFTFQDGGSDGGAAPFASSTVDLRLGKLLISFDTRIARQLNGESDDYNIYSFMIMVGK